MMKSVKGKVLGLISLIVISFLLVSWIYPFSPVSVYKNINITTDPYSAKTHIDYLNNLQKLYDESSPDDVTTIVLQNISHMFEQEWLIKNDTFKMNKGELAKMLMLMENAREGFLKLTMLEEYSYEQRSDLLMNIKNVIAMEEWIEDIMDDRWENRTVLKRQFSNLHGAYTSSLMLFNTFYGSTQR